MEKQTRFVILDARGNGNGEISPTLTGDHQNRITDYTAIVVEVRNEKATADDLLQEITKSHEQS